MINNPDDVVSAKSTQIGQSLLTFTGWVLMLFPAEYEASSGILLEAPIVALGPVAISDLTVDLWCAVAWSTNII